MVNHEHIELLKQGVTAWNNWREQNPTLKPDLSDADLSEADLSGANLAECNLNGTDLCETNLSGANIKMARLTGADCAGANLDNVDAYKADFSEAFLTLATLNDAYLAGAVFEGSDMRGAKFGNAQLNEANLRNTTCIEADFSGADLSSAVVVGANLISANISYANLRDLGYGSYTDMQGHYLGIRGLDSCFGNALFVRDAKDQEYLDTFEHELRSCQQPVRRWAGLSLYKLWGLIDFGRSFAKPTVYALILAVLFGCFYAMDMYLAWGHIDYSCVNEGLLTPFYFSVVTYTTLGYGDISPVTSVGQAVVIVEVILGYLTLGLLLSILANKVARRA